MMMIIQSVPLISPYFLSLYNYSLHVIHTQIHICIIYVCINNKNYEKYFLSKTHYTYMYNA